MRYSFEYKKKCVEMYRNGIWPETPDGIKDFKNFRNMIRRWHKLEELHGEEALRHKKKNKAWPPEEKLELVSQVLAGKSIREVSCSSGVENGTLSNWVQKYKTNGYNGLVTKTKSCPYKKTDMKRKNINNPGRLSKLHFPKPSLSLFPPHKLPVVEKHCQSSGRHVFFSFQISMCLENLVFLQSFVG